MKTLPNPSALPLARFIPISEVADDGVRDWPPSECARPRAQQCTNTRWLENFPLLGKCHIAAPGTGALRPLGYPTSEFGFIPNPKLRF